VHRRKRLCARRRGVNARAAMRVRREAFDVRVACVRRAACVGARRVERCDDRAIEIGDACAALTQTVHRVNAFGWC